MRAVCLLLQVFAAVIFARVILEWVPVSDEHPVGRVRRWLRAVTQPVLAPIRAVIPPLRVGSVAVDLSPVILILLLNLAAAALC
ncbi:MAG TPA: YggT family protein [Acidimicrobiia bacterium]|nr:YggT family protein [Acidimicrobiia bacterium]